MQSEFGAIEKPRLFGNPLHPHLLYFTFQNCVGLPVITGIRRGMKEKVGFRSKISNIRVIAILGTTFNYKCGVLLMT